MYANPALTPVRYTHCMPTATIIGKNIYDVICNRLVPTNYCHWWPVKYGQADLFKMGKLQIFPWFSTLLTIIWSERPTRHLYSHV